VARRPATAAAEAPPTTLLALRLTEC